MFAEADLLPLSGLAHMAFCERRWALVHLEQQWQENRFTAEGAQLHEKAHSAEMETRPGVLIRRTLPLRSLRLGLSGEADVVEFHPVGAPAGVQLAERRGRWQPFPVEYKRSRDKAGSIAYCLQLCAQAMCLEEMLGVTIVEGAVYDASRKRREQVAFDTPVRAEVERLTARMHELHRTGRTPSARLLPACRNCSLSSRCLPAVLASAPPVAAYLRRMMKGGE